MAFMEPGKVMTKDDAAEYLRSQQSYINAFEQINRDYEQGLRQIDKGYDDANLNYGLSRLNLGRNMMEEFRGLSNDLLQSRFSIMSSNIGQGFKEKSMSDLERAMTGAYDAYIQNYTNNLASVENAYLSSRNQLAADKQNLQANIASQYSSLDAGINNEAQLWSDLTNSPYAYLQYLDENVEGLAINPNFSKYYDISYEGGSPVYTLKNKEKLDSEFYDGNTLTDAGIDFYNQMMYGTGDLETSFNDWLYGTNKELYDWAYSTDVGGVSNRDTVFNAWDDRFKNVTSEGNYKSVSIDTPNDFDKVKTANVVYNNKDFGEVTRYQGNQTINIMNGLTLKGADIDDIREGKSENFRATYEDKNGNNRVYKMKINKDGAVADDNILADIAKNVGKIETGKIYTYGSKAYLSDVKDGTTVLREIEFRDKKSSDAFWGTLNNEEVMNTPDTKNIESSTEKLKNFGKGKSISAT